MIVYISIGNSDDKLTQARWAMFQKDTYELIKRSQIVAAIHGQWVSLARDPYQNACWCVELHDGSAVPVVALRSGLRALAHLYEQDSIAWAEVPKTEFLEAE